MVDNCLGGFMDKKFFLKKYNMIELTKEDGFEIEIIYSTPNNFTHQVLYDSPICFLRENTAKKLINANKILNEKGYKIKIWDAFRPIAYQRKMFSIYPDENFVANPDKKNCNHCKGSAIDITLCDLNGNELKMPTEFDHFGKESYRDYYNNLDEITKENVMLLENTMIECGFFPNPREWWHFNDIDEYDIILENYE